MPDSVERIGRVNGHNVAAFVRCGASLDFRCPGLGYVRASKTGARQALLQGVGDIGALIRRQLLAGCFVSIGQDGTPSLDKGLVKPEHRKQLAKLLNNDDGRIHSDQAKAKNPLPESLRRDLAACRLQIAQVEIAKHPIIALDLLVFQAASMMLGNTAAGDGADVQFKRPRLTSTSGTETTAASEAFATIAKSLCVDWLKPKSEADRFEAFRLLPDAAKLDLLAYCIALTLKPKLGAAEGDEVTAYDTALALTNASVSGYWRPTKDNYLRRITRGQLLAVGHEVLGETWSQSRASDKKASLVDQLDRAFSNPEKTVRKPEQVEKLKSWLPAGMSFDTIIERKPAKASKARKAA